MSDALVIYRFGVVLLLISAIPVSVQCICDVVKPQNTYHNRRAAALWIPFMAIVCVLWPLLLVVGILELQVSWRQRRAA